VTCFKENENSFVADNGQPAMFLSCIEAKKMDHVTNSD
jgi:hypothetical protein